MRPYTFSIGLRQSGPADEEIVKEKKQKKNKVSMRKHVKLTSHNREWLDGAQLRRSQISVHFPLHCGSLGNLNIENPFAEELVQPFAQHPTISSRLIYRCVEIVHL